MSRRKAFLGFSVWMAFLILTCMLTLMFNVQPARGWTGTVYIRTDGSIDPPNAPITTVDNVTYALTGNIYDSMVIERDNIVLDGDWYAVQGVGSETGIELTGRSGVKIKDVVIKGFSNGLKLSWSSNITVFGNSITANINSSITIEFSSNINVSGNNITANDGVGIQLGFSQNNSIFGNIITTNKIGAVLLVKSLNNSISQNKITNNPNGIALTFSSNNNSIFKNTIMENMNGIGLDESSKNNNIFENKISDNGLGILLDKSTRNTVYRNSFTGNGVGISLNCSSRNYIYQNSFLSNTKQVHLEVGGYENVWDDGYPRGGNYWSDYAGIDNFSGTYQNETGADSLGDTPYVIDADNRDRYPLMNPWTPIRFTFTPIWEDITYPVVIFGNFTVTHFLFNQSLAQVSFRISSDADKAGWINVTIPKTLLKGNPWTVKIDGQDVDFITSENVTHSFIYFTYTPTHMPKVTIQGTWVIPKSSPRAPLQSFAWIILIGMVSLATLIGAILLKKKRKTERQPAPQAVLNC